MKPLLADIKGSAQLLFELTLLQAVSNMALQVILAIDNLSAQRDDLTDEAAFKTVTDAEAISLLDEIVDTDVVSEVEERLFLMIDDGLLGEFLSELLEKIERRHARLLEAIHQLNALMGGQALYDYWAVGSLVVSLYRKTSQ